MSRQRILSSGKIKEIIEGGNDFQPLLKCADEIAKTISNCVNGKTQAHCYLASAVFDAIKEVAPYADAQITQLLNTLDELSNMRQRRFDRVIDAYLQCGDLKEAKNIAFKEKLWSYAGILGNSIVCVTGITIVCISCSSEHNKTVRYKAKQKTNRKKDDNKYKLKKLKMKR